MNNLELIVDDSTVLFLYQEKDAEELFALVNDNRSYFKEWLPWLSYTTKVGDTLKFILECRNNFETGLSLNLGIRHEGNLVGSVSFNFINNMHKNAEMGYMLSEKCTGKGIMIRCCKVLIDYGFEYLDLNRVTIKCATDNFKSRVIPEKLGFKLEGVIEQNERLYNRFVDHAHYGMLFENWNKK